LSVKQDGSRKGAKLAKISRKKKGKGKGKGLPGWIWNPVNPWPTS